MLESAVAVLLGVSGGVCALPSVRAAVSLCDLRVIDDWEKDSCWEVLAADALLTTEFLLRVDLGIPTW